MARTDIGPLYGQLGQLVADRLDDDPEGAVLYAEAGDGWAEISIFKDRGRDVVYRESGDSLFEKIYELWKAEEPGKRWATMLYRIADGKFTATLHYEDQLDPKEPAWARRNRLVQEWFGDKPVDYSDP